jgi:hypothetical protein
MSTDAREGLAPAAGNDADDGVREYHPVQMWGKGIGDPDDEMYDFRAKRDEELEVVEDIEDDLDEDEEGGIDPKDSSAAGSALAAIYETVKTPLRRFEQKSETPASVEEEATQTKETETGSSIGSETQELKIGKTKPLVET